MLSVALDGEENAPPSVAPATLVALGLDISHWADAERNCGQRSALITPNDHEEKEM